MTFQYPFFVYGTLRPGEGNYSWSLKGNTSHEVTGFLPKAEMYTNGGFPYVLENPGAKGVLGTLVYVPEDKYESMLVSLDQLEGTRYGDSQENEEKVNDRNHYNRVLRQIHTQESDPVTAWVYIPPECDYNQIRTRNRLVPSGDWMDESRSSNFLRRGRFNVHA